jgi:16S rRNA processing protein RimM|tara:strand:- start:1047 stop:1565 length:519 start_codon:yes stop_codon:yes gene_type:complete
MSSTDRKIILGKLGKPHGLKGFLYLHYYGENPNSLLDYIEVFIDESSIGRIDKVINLKNRVTVYISGIDNRNKAESLRDKDIYVNEKQLPQLDNGEFYHYQLEGLSVVNNEGEILGCIDSVMGTGANDVLVVKPSEKSLDDLERLIPYLKDDVVESINIEENIMIVEWPSNF